MSNFFEEVLTESKRTVKSDIEEFMRFNKLTAFNGSFYNAQNERLSYSEHKTIFDYNLGIREELREYCRYMDDNRLLSIMYEIPYVGYNGQIYSTKNGQIVLDNYFIEEMYLRYPNLDYNKIETIKRLICEYKTQEEMPPFNLPDAIPFDNGFRFPIEAYQILKYLIFDKANQKYIFTIMSEGDKGKSTFTNFLKCLYGNEYYSADTKYMNQFSTSYYASKRLIVFNDCASDYIENSHILKQISGGDQVQIEAKGRQGYSSRISAKMLFIGNEGISYNVLDSGMNNRFIDSSWTVGAFKKDPKWVNYKWSQEEIAYQLNLAASCRAMNYEEKLNETTKKVLASRAVFYFSDYETYLKSTKKPYSEDNFIKFFKLVSKHYSVSEWKKLVENKKDKSNINVIEIIGKDKKEIQEVYEQAILDIF